LVSYPIFFIGYVGYRQYEKVITAHFVQSVEADILQIIEDTQEDIDKLEEFVVQLKYDEAIHTFNQRYYMVVEEKKKSNVQTNLGYSGIGDYDLGKMVEGYLRSVVLSKPEIDVGGYEFEDRSTEYIISKRKSYQEENDFRIKKVFEHIREALKETQNIFAYYIDEDSNIYIGETLFDRNKFEEAGILVFKIKKEYLVDKYSKVLEGPKEGVYVVESNGKEILSKGNLPENKWERIKGFLNIHVKEADLYKNEDKQQVILYSQVHSVNLSMSSAIFISKDILLTDIRHLSKITLILCVSTLPIFLLFAAGLYKEIIYPIYTLSGKMQQIENGEIGVVMKSDRRDELGYLFSTFDKMSQRIQYLVNTVYKEEIALKNAEIKLLQDQMNPHFLYNTLEMINWKARMLGSEEIPEMIEALSGIMEINIDRRKTPFLTIEEEMRYLDNYIFLIHKRFGEKIVFKKDVDINTYALKIPRIILQPLVENAITHGIEPVGSGTIFLGVKVKEEKLVITIQDNGQGIEEDVLKDLYMEMVSEEKVTGKVGVINVQKRIKLLYGEEYGLTLSSKPNEGTLITVRLPITTTGE
jgi:two-component system sensor histidine kinase YesM